MANGCLKDKKVGFIGGGQMGESIFGGVLQNGVITAEDLYVADINAERLEQLRERYGCHVTGDALELARTVDVVVLSVRPQDAQGLIDQIGRELDSRRIPVISIMGGVTLAQLEDMLRKAPVVRVMPNTPMITRSGVAGIALGSRVDDAVREIASALFEAVGIAFVLPESLIDPLTGISGCGPAFCAMFIQAMADGGVELGLSRSMAVQLAAQTLVGTGKMVLAGEHPEILKDNVCSPAGGTVAGTHILENGGFRGLVADAVVGAVERMQDVGKRS